jgi:anti-sigma B factor antagonist
MIAAMDFFRGPNHRFRLLYVLVIVRLARRDVYGLWLGYQRPRPQGRGLQRERKRSAMEIYVEELDGGITNVVLRGRLDTASVGGIEAQFKAVVETKRAVVVDLSQTDYLSSLGVRLLMSGARAVHNKGGKLVLLSPKESVRAVLGIVGIEKFIPVVFDRSAAAAVIKKDQ